MTLEEKINTLSDAQERERTEENLQLLAEFRAALNRGEIRVAEPVDEKWKVNIWVKKGILLHLALGLLRNVSPNGKCDNFELDTLPARRFDLRDGVRLPPGGSYIRDGAYLASGVTCMPPVFVDLGAYVGSGTLLDSHVTVGIGAQIGERVQISTGTQVGGVMGPPAELLPTIIGDDVLVGGNCGVYGGVYVGKGAVLAAGTILTPQTRVYDPLKRSYYKSGPGQSLAIPPMAVVVPGARPLTKGVAQGSGLMVQLPIIAGYRDQANAAEEFLEALLE